MLRSTIASLGGLAVAACGLTPEVTPVTVTAYRCVQAGQASCDVPGEEIADGTLPPTDEAFVLVARYKGEASRWTLMFPSRMAPGRLDSAVVEVQSRDSAAVWVNLNGAKEGFYIERVTTPEASRDSIVWEYGWRRAPLVAAADPRVESTH